MDDDEEVEETQHQLPTMRPYNRDTYYVRPCYRALYPKIRDMADTDVIGFCVTVTGTPGIGKSLFYNYVFTMLRKERPDATIVTASFSQSQDVRDASVFVPNCDPRQLSGDEFNRIDESHPKSLHLYDGAPRIARSRRKMIVFTSPSPAWMKYLLKVPVGKIFFMEPWSYKELLEANRLLNLGVTEKDIYERYMLFGGVAKYCLGDSDILARGERALIWAVAFITTLRDVRDCLDDKIDVNAVVHRLFHFLPNLDKCAAIPKLVFGSRRIADMVKERLSVVTDDDYRDLERDLNYYSRAGIIRRWLFEGRCHNTLIHGGQYQIRSLDDADKTEVLVLLEKSTLKRFKAQQIL